MFVCVGVASIEFLCCDTRCAAVNVVQQGPLVKSLVDRSGELGMASAPQLPPELPPPMNGQQDYSTSRPPSAGATPNAAQYHAGARVLYNKDQVPVKGTVAKLATGR